MTKKKIHGVSISPAKLKKALEIQEDIFQREGIALEILRMLGRDLNNVIFIGTELKAKIDWQDEYFDECAYDLATAIQEGKVCIKHNNGIFPVLGVAGTPSSTEEIISFLQNNNFKDI